jgi:hypothetical protein
MASHQQPCVLMKREVGSSLPILTSLNHVPNAQVCVYLTVHITKLQLQIDENINIVIEFILYMPKFSK